MIKAIKGVSEQSWQDFKELANREHVPMGKLLEEMVERRKEQQSSIWNHILSGEKILSDEEAEEMLEVVRKIRSEYGFRKPHGTRP